MARDGFATVASLLRAEEAEMVRGVLESAGIEVVVEDAAVSALNPLWQSAVGGAKVLVPFADAERAAAVIAETGAVPGTAGEVAEIPEHEWRRAAGGEGGRAEASAARGADVVHLHGREDDRGERAAGHALRASFVALALAGTVVVPLYALSAAVRALRGIRSPSARARGRRGWALVVSALALALGVATWSWVVPALRAVERDAPAPLGAPHHPRPPNPARP